MGQFIQPRPDLNPFSKASCPALIIYLYLSRLSRHGVMVKLASTVSYHASRPSVFVLVLHLVNPFVVFFCPLVDRRFGVCAWPDASVVLSSVSRNAFPQTLSLPLPQCDEGLLSQSGWPRHRVEQLHWLVTFNNEKLWHLRFLGQG